MRVFLDALLQRIIDNIDGSFKLCIYQHNKIRIDFDEIYNIGNSKIRSYRIPEIFTTFWKESDMRNHTRNFDSSYIILKPRTNAMRNIEVS